MSTSAAQPHTPTLLSSKSDRHNITGVSDDNCAQKAIDYDVIIIGAGASGLYCALTAGRRGRRVMVIDHANKAGKKILMSGGGRCNFTNYVIEPKHFISDNPHFCKSALSRYSNWEFIGMVAAHGIAYHEREHGQLFCDDSAKDIVNMLLAECASVDAKIQLKTDVLNVQALPQEQQSATIADDKAMSSTDTSRASDASEANFVLTTSKGVYRCESLVIATGGLSIPTMGASGFGYEVATQFGHHIRPTDASLVPFTFTDQTGDLIKSLAGISLPVVAANERISFRLPMLFTHRGLSGPAMLQLSNYWYAGETIRINLLPDVEVAQHLLSAKTQHPKQRIRTVLAAHFPKKLLMALQSHLWDEVKDTELANIKDDRLEQIGQTINDWTLKPSGTEGYRTAEVTRGGIDTAQISSKTMESQLQPHLYFIGEVLDITGWLGGYNFQWAWASGFVCGEVV